MSFVEVGGREGVKWTERTCERFIFSVDVPTTMVHATRRTRLWAGVCVFLTPAQLRLTPTPGLVVRAQGRLTLP
jgi:hypothetical protein